MAIKRTIKQKVNPYQEIVDRGLKDLDKEFSQYEREQNNNYRVFMDMLKGVRPDIWVFADLIDQLGLDPYIVIKIIRQIYNIAIGTGYGQVVIAIEKGVVRYVRGEDVDKIELPVFKKRAELDNR